MGVTDHGHGPDVTGPPRFEAGCSVWSPVSRNEPVRVVVALVLVAVGVVVGVAWGVKWVLAPLLGLAILAWSRAMLRSMVHGGGATHDVEAREPAANERTLYWCEECGTELLLTVRGEATPPRHCGARMHERVELVGD